VFIANANSKSQQLVHLSAAIFTLCLLVACAAQGPPQPPRVQAPERVSDLKAAQTGRSIEIMFTLPTLATDGEQLSKPIEVQIFRRVTRPGPGQAAPPSAQFSGTASSPWVQLRGDDLLRVVHHQKVVYSDSLSEQAFVQSLGDNLRFEVRSLTRGFRGRPILSELSKPVDVRLLDVPERVEHLEPHPTKRGLALNWSPPTRTLSGRPVSAIASYRVYRSESGKPDAFQPIGESKPAEFLDTTFRFGLTYFYKVRAVVKQDAQEAESEDATLGPFTARDVFPPEAPHGLTGLYTTKAVELIWKASLEPDLAGYRVYRSEGGKPRQKVNQELLPTPIYRDTSIESGRRYFYEVTAVDSKGNESKPSEEVSVDTR